MSWKFAWNRLKARTGDWLLHSATLPLLEAQMDRIRDRQKALQPKSLLPHGRKVYSQGDEDGIIREIFQRIGTTTKIFLEIGVGDGLENNTAALLLEGWRGLWIEASPSSVDKIERKLEGVIATGALTVRAGTATRESVNNLITVAISRQDIDLLSIDIDGNDYHVFDAITCVQPRAVVIEYNGKFAPPIEFCLPYDPEARWHGDDCYGASLKFLELRLAEKGYALVGCSITGSNAFFVRTELLGDKFEKVCTAEHHYQPVRHAFCGLPSGHPASFHTLEKSLSVGRKPVKKIPAK